MGNEKGLFETKAREKLFELLVSSVVDYAIFMLDARGNVATWNAGAQRFKGYQPAEIIGRHFSTFYSEQDKKEGKPERELEIATREGRVEDEGWRLRKDGSRFWAFVVITALRDETGNLVGFAKVTRDMTERRSAEQRLRAAMAELQKSNQELEEYASFVSHDLQEPLRKMASFSELLKRSYKDQLDARANEYISYIVDGAARMRTLIVDLLDYARIGRGDPPLAQVDLQPIAATVVKDLELSVREAGAKVEVGPLPTVIGSPQRLARLLMNLIGNGIKYRHPSRIPEIVIRSERLDGEWVISVNDNGIGFEQALAQRIMRPFQRLHPKESYPGSGIGLASCQKIVALHGGRLWARSAPGVGSTFFVSFPAPR